MNWPIRKLRASFLSVATRTHTATFFRRAVPAVGARRTQRQAVVGATYIHTWEKIEDLGSGTPPPPYVLQYLLARLPEVARLPFGIFVPGPRAAQKHTEREQPRKSESTPSVCPQLWSSPHAGTLLLKRIATER